MNDDTIDRLVDHVTNPPEAINPEDEGQVAAHWARLAHGFGTHAPARAFALEDAPRAVDFDDAPAPLHLNGGVGGGQSGLYGAGLDDTAPDWTPHAYRRPRPAAPVPATVTPQAHELADTPKSAVALGLGVLRLALRDLAAALRARVRTVLGRPRPGCRM